LASNAENYFIKKDYISRNKYVHFDDTMNKDEYQNEVYLAAKKLAKDYCYMRIADIGCGSGFKLLKYFQEKYTVGFEIQPTLNFLLKKYPHRQWQNSDFTLFPTERQFDLIICADVIEHLLDPDQLLEWINKCEFEILVISTPDRDRLLAVQNNIQSQTGPPVNPAHIREWSFAEFGSYIGHYFDIIDQSHLEKEYWGQMIIAKKKR
jgi:2-polyprenyl-3-methyl-5-hydroxy-6-metoxy-1,4-benzoquinol methylase